MSKGKYSDGVCVVNNKYEIIYIDESLRRNYPDCQIHSICYEKLYHRTSVCPDCPLTHLKTNKTNFVNSLRYNNQLNIWGEYTTIKLNWPGQGECALIYVRPISHERRNIFMNLNQEQNYEELVELIPHLNTYHYLYYNSQEISLPQEGFLDDFVNQFCIKYVYFEDQKRFLDFFNILTMKQRVENVGHEVEDFCLLRSDQKYHHFSLYFQPVRKNDEDCYLCYAVNVDQRYNKISSYLEKGNPVQIDPLTHLYKQNAFEKLVKERLEKDQKTLYALMSIDIEHFKYFNDWYGHEEGDKLLKYVAKCINKLVLPLNGYVSRVGNDNFICLLPFDNCQIKDMESLIATWIQNYDSDCKFLPAVGIYPIYDYAMSITLMCERAAMAANSIKEKHITRVAIYQDALKQESMNDQKILFGVKKGLENQEFEIYFQPQCSARTHKIIGAEALVRWNHPTKGLLLPQAFIPILESSGFIYKLDNYVWEKTCEYLHNRIIHQLPIVPISVNVSRLDIYQYNLVKVFEDLCQKYQIPTRYLEIEITESAYSDNFSLLVETISQLRSQGFKVLMDDFGSGYSALNMLKDIEVDILKIDMKFLELNEKSLNKGTSILESVILMAKWLKMGLIAEGVETNKQVNHLLNMNCEYMQGYHFYHPMTQQQFTQLLSNEKNIDTRDVMIECLPTIELDDLFHKDITSEAMLNNILGGIAIYEIDNQDRFSIKKVNDTYYRITGCNPVDLQTKSHEIMNQVPLDDQQIVMDIFKRAETAGHLGASGIFRRYRLSGELMWMNLKAFLLHKDQNHKIFYGSVSDYTKQMKEQSELQMILNTVQGNIVRYWISDDGVTSHILNHGFLDSLGYSEEELNRILKKDNGIGLIAPEDQQKIIDMFAGYDHWDDNMNLEYHCLTKDGKRVNIHQNIRFFGCEEGIRIYCSLCTKIEKG